LRSSEAFKVVNGSSKTAATCYLPDSNPFLKNRLHSVGHRALLVRKNAYAGLAILAVSSQNGDFHPAHLCI
jgi:hypothetical protein